MNRSFSSGSSTITFYLDLVWFFVLAYIFRYPKDVQDLGRLSLLQLLIAKRLSYTLESHT